MLVISNRPRVSRSSDFEISCDCKKATRPESSDACRFCGVNFKISVRDYGGKTKYISTRNLFKISEWAGIDKIRLAILLKINRGAEMDLRMENLPVNEKQPLFARALTPILYDSKDRQTFKCCALMNIVPQPIRCCRQNEAVTGRFPFESLHATNGTVIFRKFF